MTRREVELRGIDTLLATPLNVEARSRQEFARLMQGLPEVVRVKVWDRDFTVLWSDEPKLIGRRFPDNDELQEALGGKVSVEIKTLRARENAYERARFTTLAEVYVPIVRRLVPLHAASPGHEVAEEVALRS